MGSFGEVSWNTVKCQETSNSLSHTLSSSFSLRGHLNVGSANLAMWEIRRQAVFLGSPVLNLTLTHVTPMLTVSLRGTGTYPARYANN